MKISSKIDNRIDCRAIENGAWRSDCRTSPAELRRQRMARSKTNFRGENNGLRPAEPGTTEFHRNAERPLRWEVSNPTCLGCTISVATFGNGAPILIKVEPVRPAAIGECCAAALGRRRTSWRCNRRIATSLIEMNATSSTVFVACSRQNRRRIGNHFAVSSSRRRSRNWTCAGLILRLAISSGKNSARSTSGNSLNFPERGGHSS